MSERTLCARVHITVCAPDVISFQLFKILFLSMCVFVSLCVYYMSEGACRGQEEVSGVLELELQVVVSCPAWCWKLNFGSLEDRKHS